MSISDRAVLEGRLEEAQVILRILIESQFGKINKAWQPLLKRLSLAQSEELVSAMQQFQRPADLTRWLKAQATNGG